MEDTLDQKEEIQEDQNDAQDAGDEEDDDKTVLTVDAKMGSEEIPIRTKIEELAKPWLDNEELDIDSPEVMEEEEKKLAKLVQDMLLKDYGKYWGVVVGKRFAMGCGLKEADKFGNFKIGFFNVLVFQCNQTEAAA